MDENNDMPLPPVTDGGFLSPAPSAARQGEGAGQSAYRVLARTYRPRVLDDLIGQENLVRVLERAFETGRVAHAFMLTGVRGVGKTTTARILARALNCTGADGTGHATAAPCGVCPNCTAILAGNHPDVLEIDAASRTGVNDIREVIEATQYRPIQGRMKVFIIDEVHMLSTAAFNALLKTLEEPPPQVTFVFATTELRKIPVTVLSRCQRFDLRRVPQAMLVEHYGRIAAKEGANLAPEALNLIARAADGSVRDGLSLLDQAIAQGASDAPSVAAMLGQADRAMVFDLLEAMLEGQGARTLALAEQAWSHGIAPEALMADLLEATHSVSRLRAVPALRQDETLPELERERGSTLADKHPMGVLARTWQILLKGAEEIAQAPQGENAAEMVFIRLLHASQLPTPERILARLAKQENQQNQNLPSSPAPHQGAGVSRAPVQGGLGTAPLKGAQQPVPQTVSEQGSAPQAFQGSLQGPGAAATMPPSQARFGSVRLEGGAERVPAPMCWADDSPEEPAAKLARPTKRDTIPLPRSWREMVRFTSLCHEPWLHGILRCEAHMVRFADHGAAPWCVSVRLDDKAVRQRALKLLSERLEEYYPGQWHILPSDGEGEPTLEAQGAEVIALHHAAAGRHPLVRAILKRFPGARMGTVRDTEPEGGQDAGAENAFTLLGAGESAGGTFQGQPYESPFALDEDSYGAYPFNEDGDMVEE
ncbi:DNA polymerase III subunit gamma/tau [Formicincola oecophyllae]|nr:DNA polymerase III subunit gamma/tau [Formicincola oecophyllae]